MQTKTKLLNSNNFWNPNRRYKVNAVVDYFGVTYQNSTGINSDPTLGLNWIVIKGIESIQNGNFTIYKNNQNNNYLNRYLLEPLDVGIGWLPNTQIFIPVGQYLGGNPNDINNWNTSPMDFTT